MADSTIVRSNERVKMIAGGIFQLGTALFAAAIVKAYVDASFSFESAGWFLTSLVIMFVAVKALALLESES